MAGYNGTSFSALNLAIGQQNLTTQAALDYVPGDIVQIAYTPNQTVFMSALVLAYNPVTGLMTVNVQNIFGNLAALQPVWNTQPWGSIGGTLGDWTLTLLAGVPTDQVPVTPSIIVRTLDSNWDPQRGNGLQNFLTDADAVAQIIAQRLKFLQGEWFENTQIGTPLFQSILGKSTTSQAVALLLQQQILAVPFVTGIATFDIDYASSGRVFSYSAVVNTQFGQVTVTQ